jgi:hypothetical protein
MFGEPFRTNQPSVTQLTTELRDGMTRRLAQFRQYVAPLDTVPASQARLDLIVGAIQQAAQMEALASGYVQQADAFRQTGRPELGELVDFALNDMANATRIYVQMYQETVETMARISQIVDEAHRVATLNILITTMNTQARFDHWTRRIIGVNTQTCPTCGLYFGSSSPYWRWCPCCGVAR